MDINWDKFSLVARYEMPKAWFIFQNHLGLAANTLQAYGYALNDYLDFCQREDIKFEDATKEHIARYIHDLRERPRHSNVQTKSRQAGQGLSHATMQQRLTVIRLFYAHLVEDGYRQTNPVRKGHYAHNNPTGGQRGLVPTFQRPPWIPNEDEWQRILEATKQESIRNRFMFALAYDAGLRREELCLLATNDLDPSRRMLTIRAETTKNRRGRTVPYSETTSILYGQYLQRRRQISQARGALFISESPLNCGNGITKWSWTKVVQRIAQQADVG